MPNLQYLGIGINYKNTSNALNGCINDIYNANDCWKNYAKKINKNYISTILTDDTIMIPTKQIIITSLINQLKILQPKDTFIFHYSGHGTYRYDSNRDELNGWDEEIVPLDLIEISDDELNDIFMKYGKTNVQYICFFDSCFSGTVLDLQYTYNEKSKIIRNNNKNMSFLNIISISGCTDFQTSADAFISNQAQGAMTASFLLSFKQNNNNNNNNNNNWINLIQLMRNWLRLNKFTQIPLLGCSNPKLLSNYIYFK